MRNFDYGSDEAVQESKKGGERDASVSLPSLERSRIRKSVEGISMLASTEVSKASKTRRGTSYGSPASSPEKTTRRGTSYGSPASSPVKATRRGSTLSPRVSKKQKVNVAPSGDDREEWPETEMLASTVAKKTRRGTSSGGSPVSPRQSKKQKVNSERSLGDDGDDREEFLQIEEFGDIGDDGTTLWRVTSSILRSSNLTKSILTSSSITMGSSSIFRRYYPVFIFLLIAARNIISRCIFWYRALETLLGALTPIDHARAQKTEVHAALMNSDLLSRGAENITPLLSLLAEEDFYVRYYTLQILTALLMNSQNRLQEAILTTPRGITRLMDMLMDREVTVNYILDIFNVAISLFKSLVIRNEAFLLLTHLTREAERHQGGRGFRWRCGCAGLSGVVEKSSSQQFIKPDNQYADMGGAVTDPGKDSNKLANRTVLVQKKLLDHLLMLGVESQWSPVAVRCMTFKCIGDLVDGHPKNRDILASKVLGEDRQAEPALNSILRIILQTSSSQEFVAADYVFKTFCEKCYLHSLKTFSQKSGRSSNVSFNFSTRDPLEDDVNMSFGRCCICSGETDGYLETCCRAASILSHVVKDNIQCKKKALKIVLESHVPSMGTPEPLFQRIVSFIFSSSSEGPREDHEPLTRTATPSEAEIEDVDVAGAMDKGNEDHPMLISLFDPSFTGLVKSLEVLRERIVDVYSRPKSEVAVVPADLEQRSGESEKDYINRLKAFIEKQCSEIQNLLARNAALAEDVASSRRKHSCETRIRPKGPVGRIQQSRTSELPSRERGEILVKEEVRKEAQKESEDELNDLLVCLGQEESKVEKLTAKLVELGVDVDKLLEDIGDESQAQGECEDDDDDDR
ncbi:hypothetical protein HID58_049309 [Brassica napus]|uniref:Uso1/p115-like vesicle tethering protein C-terminal domain-containing protein n=2 Tax=Brassica TaxID=3705 RepID=A0ABQ8B4M7_BRANA|nr:hypothetical protein HID58_049309 [Brassica napus]